MQVIGFYRVTGFDHRIRCVTADRDEQGRRFTVWQSGRCMTAARDEQGRPFTALQVRWCVFSGLLLAPDKILPLSEARHAPGGSMGRSEADEVAACLQWCEWCVRPLIDWEALLARLPASTREIAEVIGYDRALHLVASRPTNSDAKHGPRVFLSVPKSAGALSPEHPLVRALNMGGKPDAAEAALEAARKLIDTFGGEVLNPARCAILCRGGMHHHIGEALARGTPAKQIAEQLAETEARLMDDWIKRGSIPEDKPRKIALTPRQIRNIGKSFWRR